MFQCENNTDILYIPSAQIRQHIGKLYVNNASDEDISQLILLFKQSSQDMVLYPITPVPLKDSCHDSALVKRLSREDVTFITLIINPSEGVPSFLTRRATKGSIALQAIEFCYEADQKTRQALSLFAETVPGFDSAQARNEISFHGRRTPRIGKEEKQKRLRDAQASFVESVKLERSKKDPKASKDVDLVINNLPESSKLLLIRKYIDTLSEEEIQKLYEDSVDMKALAERSRVKIIVRKRYVDRDDPTRHEDIVGTLGEYRICYRFNDEGNDHLLDFKSKADNAVYLCCLLARKKYGDLDKDFSDLEKLFIGSFRLIYGDSYLKARTTFLLLLDEFDQVSHRVIQGRLKDCISGIRETIDEELLHKENPSIFYYRKNRQLGILNRNIIIPDNLYEKVLQLGEQPSVGVNA